MQYKHNSNSQTNLNLVAESPLRAFSVPPSKVGEDHRGFALRPISASQDGRARKGDRKGHGTAPTEYPVATKERADRIVMVS